MTTGAPVPTQLPPAGWYPAPDVANAQRWWNGSTWSEHVKRLPPAPTAPAASTMVDAPLPAWLLPTNRSWVAIVAGYLGLFALVIIPAPLALVAGVAALVHLRRRPELGGRGRAWFGAVAGGLGTGVLVVALLAA